MALLGVKVPHDALKVGTATKTFRFFPHMVCALEAGLLSLENGVTKMPLMAILYLNQIVKVIPLDVADPFLVDWGNLEVVAALSLHLILRFAALRKVTEMQLSEFRPIITAVKLLCKYLERKICNFSILVRKK